MMQSIDNMILEIMSSKFWDHYWHGYDEIRWQLLHTYGLESISINEVKARVKGLRVLDKLEVRPLFDDSTGLLCGSGYFIKQQKP